MNRATSRLRRLKLWLTGQQVADARLRVRIDDKDALAVIGRKRLSQGQHEVDLPTPPLAFITVMVLRMRHPSSSMKSSNRPP